MRRALTGLVLTDDTLLARAELLEEVDTVEGTRWPHRPPVQSLLLCGCSLVGTASLSQSVTGTVTGKVSCSVTQSQGFPCSRAAPPGVLLLPSTLIMNVLKNCGFGEP